MKHASRLVATPHAASCMEKARELLARPRPAGNWWASEVMEKKARGERVSVLALEMARAALAPKIQREPGEDREEDDISM